MNANKTTTPAAHSIASINAGRVKNLFADCLEAYAVAWSENNATEADAPLEIADRTPAQIAFISAREYAMNAAHDVLLSVVDLHTAQQVHDAIAALPAQA